MCIKSKRNLVGGLVSSIALDSMSDTEKQEQIYEERPRGVIYEDKPPDLSAKGISTYLSTRLSTLLDLPNSRISVINPIPALRAMSASDWNWYGLGFVGWVIDAMDYFVVSAAATDIAKSLDVSVTEITWGMTLVLMVRSIGAIIFGFMSDRIGRKWPYIACCAMFMVLEIGLGFVKTYKQFLGVRAIFGIAMGGMYGTAAATALENLPDQSRSILAGLFPTGYNFGFILAVVFYRAFQFSYKEGEGWRALCWFSAGPPFLLIIWRLCFPEGRYFDKLKEKREQEKHLNIGIMQELKEAFRNYWLIFLYLILIMSGLNFLSHGTQDLYPTLLTTQAGMNPDIKTVTMVVFNLGAMCGGLTLGQISELLGRRLGIICGLIWTGAFVYSSFMIHSPQAIIPSSFFLQFGCAGAWSAAPIYLLELSPATYRALASGLAYQLGNLASSASSTIEATIGSRFPIEGKHEVYDYGKVMAIFTACVILYLMIITFLGPERFHRELHDFTGAIPDKESEEVDEHVVVVDKTGMEYEHRP
uniref:ARAD1D14168p n=1 Tax=Blastobotrys adeninivorans TaxID=409370 RepID=A0A060TEC0_BLAAD